MRPSDIARATVLRDKLIDMHKACGVLPGIETAGYLDCLVAQLIDSLRRIEFVHHLRGSKIDPRRGDPYSPFFDPLRAAIIESRTGHNDEAWWLVFLATHFGKHAKDGWRLARDIYGRLGTGPLWSWAAISA